MFRVLYWLAFIAFVAYLLIVTWGEIGGYSLILIALIAWFIWELVRAIKNL